jgi:hypothetical protein|tara:strand:+ start:196 stop:1800 length:1605 start_codon:yes stop_codon:yes gene_type:complete
MGWQDDPVVVVPKKRWQDDPIAVSEAGPVNEQIQPPIAGGGPDGSDLNWNDPGFPVSPPPWEQKWYEGDPGSYSGTFLPFSRKENAEPDLSGTDFDSNAGIVGPIKRTGKLTNEVYRGEVDPSSQEGLMRSLEAATVISPMSTALRAGRSLAPKTAFKQPEKPTPTSSELSSATSRAYDHVAELDVHYSSSAVEKMVTNLENSLNKEGFISEIKGVGDIHSLIGKLKGGPKGSSVRMKQLDIFRQRLGDIAGSPKKQVQNAASRAIDAIDDFIASANPSNLAGRPSLKSSDTKIVPQGFSFAGVDAAGNRALAKEASETILKARSNAAAGFRSENIDSLKDVMQLRTSASGSGATLDNTTRSKLVSLLTSSGGKGVRGFSGPEKDAIRQIIIGTPTKNALRRVGNMLGGGGGIKQTMMTALPALTVGVAGGGFVPTVAAMIPGVVGAVSKAASNRMAKKEINKLDDTVRKRSSLYKETPKPKAKYQPGAVQGASEAMTRALLPAAAQSYQKGPNGQAYEIGPNGGYMVDGIEYF